MHLENIHLIQNGIKHSFINSNNKNRIEKYKINGNLNFYLWIFVNYS